MDARRLTPDFAVSPQLSEADMAAAAEAGFTMIVNNRPDGEVPDQPTDAAMAKAAAEAGLAYRHIPITPTAFSDMEIQAIRAAIADAEGPVLAYCRSGTRSTYGWAYAEAKQVDPETLVKAAAAAGYDLSAHQPALAKIHSGEC